METGAPPVNEAVNLLSKFEPAALERLRQRLPAEIQPLLIPGGLAGPIQAELVALAQIQLDGLECASKYCARAIDVALHRLKLARLLRLIGGAAAIVGSSSLFVTIPITGPVGAYVGGGIALLGSLISFFTEYLTKPESAGSLSLFQLYAGLVDQRYRAECKLNELRAYLSLEITPKRAQTVKDLIGQGNELCRQVNQACAILLVSTVK
jgi:hypothetical protein